MNELINADDKKKENILKILPENIYLLESEEKGDQSIMNILNVSEIEIKKARLSERYLQLKSNEVDIEMTKVDIKRLKRIGTDGGILDQLLDSIEFTLVPMINNDPETFTVAHSNLVVKMVDRIERVANQVNNVINVSTQNEKERKKIEQKFIVTENERIDTLFSTADKEVLAKFTDSISKALLEAEIASGLAPIDIT